MCERIHCRVLQLRHSRELLLRDVSFRNQTIFIKKVPHLDRHMLQSHCSIFPNDIRYHTVVGPGCSREPLYSILKFSAFKTSQSVFKTPSSLTRAWNGKMSCTASRHRRRLIPIFVYLSQRHGEHGELRPLLLRVLRERSLFWNSFLDGEGDHILCVFTRCLRS